MFLSLSQIYVSMIIPPTSTDVPITQIMLALEETLHPPFLLPRRNKNH